MQDAAPEVTDVVVEGMTAPPPPGPQLLQIGRRPGADTNAGNPERDANWVTLPGIGPPSARPVSATAGDLAVLVCSVRGTLYAYRDGCAACGSSLADGALDREQLSCPGCGARYNVRLAGRGLDDPALHLEPLPLLTDSAGVRVAVPESVGSVNTGLRRFVPGAPQEAPPARPAAEPAAGAELAGQATPAGPAGQAPVAGPAPAGGPVAAAGPAAARQPGLRRPARQAPEEKCEFCATPVAGGTRSRGRPRDLDADVRLPRLLSAVHPFRRRADLAAGPAARTGKADRPGAVPRDPGPLPQRSWPPADAGRVGRPGDPGRSGVLPAQLGGRRNDRVLPEPGGRHRVPPRPGGLGPDRGRPPAAGRGRAGRRGDPDLARRARPARRRDVPGPDRCLLRAGRADAPALARL